MTFRNTEYLVLVDANGDFVSGQVKRVQLAPDGTPFPAPPIDFEQADLTGLLEQFNIVVLRENTALKAQAAQLTQVHATTVESLQSQINQLNSNHSAAISTLRTQLAAAQADAASNAAAAQLTETLQAQVASLTARVASLAAIAPFDPRKITVNAFLHRLTQAELLMLFSDSDPGVQQIGGLLKQWAANDWPIVFESQEFTQAMGYLVQIGKLTQDRVAAITVDASREEAPAA